MELDVASLLEPIEGGEPAGRDLRQAGQDAALYYRLKEARFGARARERQADAEADGAVQPPEWRTLFDGTRLLLAQQTKDIEIATWLIEASLRLRGFAGLCYGLLVLDGLVERYWDSLHSIDLETVADKVAPIAGLNGIDGEGALIQPIRLTPLAAGAEEPAGLWLWQQAARGGAESRAAKQVAAAVKATARERFAAVSQELHGAWLAFRQLSERLDRACGADAPPLSTIRTVLEEAREALRQMSGIDPAAEAEALAAAGRRHPSRSRRRARGPARPLAGGRPAGPGRSARPARPGHPRRRAARARPDRRVFSRARTALADLLRPRNVNPPRPAAAGRSAPRADPRRGGAPLGAEHGRHYA